MKKRGLGRGLDVLLNKTKLPTQDSTKNNEAYTNKEAGTKNSIGISLIEP